MLNKIKEKYSASVYIDYSEIVTIEQKIAEQQLLLAELKQQLRNKLSDKECFKLLGCEKRFKLGSASIICEKRFKL